MRTPKSRHELEQALDSGELWVKAHNGRYYRCRRNGATKTWKTHPADFRLPVKWALRTCHAITLADYKDGAWWIASSDPNAKP